MALTTDAPAASRASTTLPWPVVHAAQQRTRRLLVRSNGRVVCRKPACRGVMELALATSGRAPFLHNRAITWSLPGGRRCEEGISTARPVLRTVKRRGVQRIRLCTRRRNGLRRTVLEQQFDNVEVARLCAHTRANSFSVIRRRESLWTTHQRPDREAFCQTTDRRR